MATLTMTDDGVLQARPEGIDLKSRLLAYERDLITAALAATSGNQRRAARQLGILPTTLHEKMKRLGLRVGPFMPGGGPQDASASDGAAASSADTGPRA